MRDSQNPRGLNVNVVQGVALCLAGGAVSGLVTVLIPWLGGWNGMLEVLGLDPNTSSPLVAVFRYTGLRALWGLAFFPFLDGVRLNPSLAGFFVSLFFTAFELLIGFPVIKQAGFLGLAHGWVAPLGVSFLNLAWGILTAFLVRWVLFWTVGQEHNQAG